MTIFWIGPALAATTVVTIAAGHHLVRELSYHFGTRAALPLFFLGAVILASSFLVSDDLLSAVLGIVGLTTLVDGNEILRQEKRIIKGHAPENPNRPVRKRS